ncbi:MAG: methyltransferase domain-containing protein [Pseudomonadota bacterium]|nr:methyltransferase domain-containing protein [Pseudomonadota bacterium]
MEESKRLWLQEHLRCPSCRTVGIEIGVHEGRCPRCGRRYPTRNGALDCIDSDTASRFNIVDTENISDHVYDGNAGTILQRVLGRGGHVLDCGSGKRQFRQEHLIQVEIAPYDNVDVLAVNQELPFVDGCFDAVFSLSVLEHVSDPFASARELARVLKPGGVLYIDLPFLQAEHGYPHHYFDATREGLRKLFDGLLKVDGHLVPDAGHPIQVLLQVLGIYHDHLPPAERQTFAGLTVGEILARRPWTEWIGDPLMTALSEEGRWTIAATTQALLRKPTDADDEERAVGGVTPSNLPGF